MANIVSKNGVSDADFKSIDNSNIEIKPETENFEKGEFKDQIKKIEKLRKKNPCFEILDEKLANEFDKLSEMIGYNAEEDNTSQDLSGSPSQSNYSSSRESVPKIEEETLNKNLPTSTKKIMASCEKRANDECEDRTADSFKIRADNIEKKFKKISCILRSMKDELKCVSPSSDPHLDKCDGTAEDQEPSQSDDDSQEKRLECLEKCIHQYKCLISEQAEHLENYRIKFRCAQQTVLEQNCKIQGFHDHNKRLEGSIREEMECIRQKVSKKMKKYEEYPTLLANLKRKYCDVSAEKCDIEKKLLEAVQQVEKFKEMLEKYQKNKTPIRDDGKQLRSLKKENEELKESIRQLETEKDKVMRKLNDIAKDLERAKIGKRVQQQQIDALEKDLAKARANGTCVINSQEECMRMMQTQLENLNDNFQDTQNQVQNLRKYINGFQNEGNNQNCP